MAENERIEWLQCQIVQALEIEMAYVESRMVYGVEWSPQAERMLKQVRENRVYFEGKLAEAQTARPL